MKSPDECRSQDEVREQIDRIDNALVDLLAERWGYIDRMWQFKRVEAASASVPWRNREVVEKVRARAENRGVPPELAEGLWRMIIGWGIQHQEEKIRED